MNRTPEPTAIESADRCVSVVMPVYNEVATIESVVRTVLEQPCVGELMIVDDASNDGSEKLIASLAASLDRVRTVRHDRNRGKGAAVREGFAAARLPIILIQDADLEYAPREYSRLIAPIIRGDADVVFGSRFVGADAHRVLYFWHSVGNRFLTLLSNMTTNLNLTDMECCFKAFRAGIVSRIDLEEDRFGIEPEITAKVASLGVRIFEVGVGYNGRTYAEGKKIGWRDGFRALYAIGFYGIWRRIRPRRLQTETGTGGGASGE